MWKDWKISLGNTICLKEVAHAAAKMEIGHEPFCHRI